MRVSNVLFAVIVLISFVSLLCIWFYPSVHDFMESNTMWNGIRDFSREFNATGIESMDDTPEIPVQTTLIAIPYREYTDKDLLKMKRLVDGGGTLVLMDDYGYGNSILEYLGVDIRFTNKPMLDPLFCYKNEAMPRITDFAPRVIESGIEVIMLNHATTLTNVPDSDIIARSSGSSFLDINENGSLDQGEPEGPFAVAAELKVGKGTLAIVSDPSIIINTMVKRDNNYDFIRYLTARQGEQKEVMIDYSHLTKAPLDASRTKLINTREALSSPYALLVITAIIFITVSRYTLKKGESIG